MLNIKHLLIIALAAGCLSAGCSTKTSYNPDDKMVGGSYETAVLLAVRPEGDCLMAQYEWIKSHYPHAHMAELDENTGEILGHRTEERDGRIYSVFPLRLDDGRLQRVYFDITDWD